VGFSLLKGIIKGIKGLPFNPVVLDSPRMTGL
jgi:hypothetical protein